MGDAEECPRGRADAFVWAAEDPVAGKSGESLQWCVVAPVGASRLSLVVARATALSERAAASRSLQRTRIAASARGRVWSHASSAASYIASRDAIAKTRARRFVPLPVASPPPCSVAASRADGAASGLTRMCAAPPLRRTQGSSGGVSAARIIVIVRAALIS